MFSVQLYITTVNIFNTEIICFKLCLYVTLKGSKKILCINPKEPQIYTISPMPDIFVILF